MANELTKSEVADYSRFKETIVRAAEDATNALVEIHDRRLYRHEFATFDDFCQAFGKSVRTVTNKIAANRVDFNISAKIAEIPQSDNVKISATVAETRSILPSVLPNLSQAAKLALAKLPEDKQSGALADAVDKAKERGNDTPTTADVKEVVKLYQAQAEPYQEPEGEEESDAAPFDEPAKPANKTGNKPSRKPAKEASDADKAKAQVKLWYDTIARWLGQSPSIDEYNAAFGGKPAYRALHAAKELYEALKAWHGVIK